MLSLHYFWVRAGESEARRVALHTPFHEDFRIRTRSLRASTECLAYLTDAIGERKAEGVGVFLGVAGVHVLNVA